ncbi:MAG: DEAD/DEAH box helicase, partial [Acidimicrobiia bacterium]
MTSFSDLGLRGALVAALSKNGITEPFPIQEQTIRDSLAGRDVCGKARTGSGKTLAFGLPMLEKIERGASKNRPRALVLAPTRELASQIVDALRPLAKPLGLHVAAFYGGAPMDRQIQFLQRGVDIAVATPGRLTDLTERKSFRFDDIQYVVIDEADHMADMGFLPQVEWIMRQLPHKDGKPTPQMLLFSATLDGDVDVLIRRYMHDPVHHEVVVPEDEKADVVHRFFEVHNMDRVRVAAEIAKSAGRTIAFVRTKRAADRVSDQLEEHGVRSAPIHG